MTTHHTIQDVTAGGFSTTSVFTTTSVEVKLVGCLDMQTTPLLRGFLDQLIPVVKGGDGAAVEFDMRELYMMSSSSISCLAGWIKNLKDLRVSCRVRFRTNQNLSWQRRTLGPIRRFAEQIVVVE